MPGIELDNFRIPADADTKTLKRIMAQGVQVGDGVTSYSGHDRGLPFFFFEGEIKNELQSKLAGSDIYEPVDMIEYRIDKFTKHHEIVTEAIINKYPVEWDRYKKGLEAPGTPLLRWGKCSKAQLRTLNAANIFSVEQLASTPKTKLAGKFPKDIQDLQEQAIHFTNAAEGRSEIKDFASKLAESEKEKSIMQAQMNAMQKQLESLAAAPTPETASKKGTKKKTATPGVVETEEG